MTESVCDDYRRPASQTPDGKLSKKQHLCDDCSEHRLRKHYEDKHTKAKRPKKDPGES